MQNRAAVLFGLGLLLCMAGLTYLYLSVPAGLPQPPFWSPRPNHSVEVSALYREAIRLPPLALSPLAFHWWNLILLTLCFGCYIGAVSCFSGDAPGRAALGITALLTLVLLVMPPLFATDVFYYAIAGQIAGQLGANPYVQTPAEFPQSALLAYNYWVDIPTPYGPVWTLLSSLIARGTGGAPLLTTVMFKVVGAVATLTTARLIWNIVRPDSATYAAKATLLFVWNPAVLLESIGNAHNDIVMAALTIAAVMLLYKTRYQLGWLALLLATLLKYLTAPALGIYFLARIRPGPGHPTDRWKMAGLLVVLAVVVTVLVWAPYWVGLSTLASLTAESSRGFSGLLATIILRSGQLLGISSRHRQTAALIGSVVGLLAGMIWIGVRLLRMWRQGATYSLRAEISDWAYALLLIMITLPRSHPWKLLPALALFAVTYPQTRRGTILAYALAGAWFLYRAASW